MKLKNLVRGRWRIVSFPLLLWALFTTGQMLVEAISDDPEIALMIGEPWEDMRQRYKLSFTVMDDIYYPREQQHANTCLHDD